VPDRLPKSAPSSSKVPARTAPRRNPIICQAPLTLAAIASLPRVTRKDQVTGSTTPAGSPPATNTSTPKAPTQSYIYPGTNVRVVNGPKCTLFPTIDPWDAGKKAAAKEEITRIRNLDADVQKSCTRPGNVFGESIVDQRTTSDASDTLSSEKGKGDVSPSSSKSSETVSGEVVKATSYSVPPVQHSLPKHQSDASKHPRKVSSMDKAILDWAYKIDTRPENHSSPMSSTDTTATDKAIATAIKAVTEDHQKQLEQVTDSNKKMLEAKDQQINTLVNECRQSTHAQATAIKDVETAAATAVYQIQSVLEVVAHQAQVQAAHQAAQPKSMPLSTEQMMVIHEEYQKTVNQKG
jgi:hypothetical protein